MLYNYTPFHTLIKLLKTNIGQKASKAVLREGNRSLRVLPAWRRNRFCYRFRYYCFAYYIIC